MKNSIDNYQYSSLRSAVSRGIQVGLFSGSIFLIGVIFIIIKALLAKDGTSWFWGLLPVSIFGLLALGSFFDSWRCKRKLKQYLKTLSPNEKELLEQIETTEEDEKEENNENEMNEDEYEE